MNLLGEKQKTKLLLNGVESINFDCFIKKCFPDRILLSKSQGKRDFSELAIYDDIQVKVYTPKGIVIFNSEINKIISVDEIEIKYDENNVTVEDTRQNPRYEASCPITIFRPLQGNVEAQLIDISVRGLRFYSETSLDENSIFEIMLYLSDTVGKIILTGRVLDKIGLPAGVHRMIIEDISYSDRQKLVDFCLSLAK